MKTILHALLFSVLFLPVQTVAAQIPDAPLLFTKQYNYQGLHIYDAFYQWRPGGGIYVLENPNDPSEKHRIRPVIDPTTPETLGEGVYSDVSLSFDATKILFCFKGTPGGNTSIFEIGVDGKGLRQVTNLDKNGNPYKGSGGGHHDVSPCYLPDDRIVFCSTRYSGLVPCANNGVSILHVMNNDGSDIHTISVNNVTEFDPCVLPDGRILFGRWEYIDKNALTIQSLWTVNPCGTNETAMYANNMVFPEAILQAKPVHGNPDLIVGTFAPHNAPPRGAIAMIDLRNVEIPGQGKNNPDAIFNFEHPDKPTHDRGESRDPWAIDENNVLYSGIPNTPNAPVAKFDKRSSPVLNAIMLIDRTGKKTVVLSDPMYDLKRPIPVIPREKPPVLADTTDRTKIEGDFFVHDVYAGMPTVPRGSVKWLRVVEETSRVSESPGGSWMNQTFSISAALAWSPKIYHGIVPVQEDGSVYFTAPSGRALSFQLLDAEYRLVRGMRTFIQAAPGTARSCTGCHLYDTAPPSSLQSKMRGRAPERLRDESWGSGYFEYTKLVQPILDRKCVSCHGGEKGFAGGLDLSGGETEMFNISYENLTARREKQYVADLIAGICCMNGTAYWSCKIFEPYEHGSGKAPLAEVLLKDPHLKDAGLTPKERETIFTWIDGNGLYFGTWDYTKTGPACREYGYAKSELVDVMRQYGCVECHGDANGNIQRFDDWINLENPRMSRILRAPLDPNAKDGFGVGLCRSRKVDPKFSRLGLMFKSGYEHAVRNLDQFPTQQWKPWSETTEGEPVISFKSTQDPVYRKMLEIMEKAAARQRANPRADMPGANEVGNGIVAGRSRQIIPQPLPETMPKLEGSVDIEGTARLHWDRSCRTIGLVSEIHRSVAGPEFVPNEETLVNRTELFEYTDTGLPPGEKVHYALVFVSDPATTCGTCKSGAVLRFGATGFELSTAPSLQSIEGRCPLSDFKPMRSEPAFVSFDVPARKVPDAPTNVRADVSAGFATLYWDVPPFGAYEYRVYRTKNNGTSLPVDTQPTRAGFMEVPVKGGEKATFTVRRIGRGGESEDSASVTVESPELEIVTVLDMNSAKGEIIGAAQRKEGDIDTSAGGYWKTASLPEFDVNAPFECEFDVTIKEPGQIPVVVSSGRWRHAGWFLQSIGGRWRFHVGGVDCDGGKVSIGEKTHIRATSDCRTLRLFQDGQLVAEISGSVNKSPWRGGLMIGQYSGEVSPQFQFNGTVEGLTIRRSQIKRPPR